jgi:calcium-dependent protein kinase
LAAYEQLYPEMDKQDLKAEATAIFKKADVDGSGALDYGEWSAATINKRELLNEANLNAAFGLFDKNGSGTIDAKEVASILGQGFKCEND